MTNEIVLAALRGASDARGYKLHELVALVAGETRARHRVRAIMAELLDQGVVEKTEGGRYRVVGWVPVAPPVLTPGLARAGGKVAAKPGQASGVIRVHPAGYGFVVREDGEGDVFVSARSRGAALDGDRVALDTWMGFKGTEGKVAEVLARGRARITGTLRMAGRTPFLEADDPRVHGHISLDGGAGSAREGQVVVADIVVYPAQPDDPMSARVIKILGEPGDPETEINKIIACAEIPDEFPDDVRLAGERAPTEVTPPDLADRADLRDRDFLTIDPETARDFDDACCVEDGPNGTDRLWVAVADVSHYVRQNTALDREARTRGVSVYLPNRAIPMLPHQLSAGICSLNPEVDRLAMVARVDVDQEGVVVGEQVVAAVIRSRARLDYAGVASALGGDFRGTRARYRDHLPQLQRLDAVARRLRAVRRERGSLDFDLPEAQVILDEDDPKRVRDVRKSRSQPEVKDAYRLVEDCMLAANEAVARFFLKRNLDTLWRVHAVPKQERLEEFAAIAESFGVPFAVEDARSPKKLRAFLETIAGKPMERALSYLLLRTLKQAIYDVTNVGHFGLAASHYLHFTSPIRRYPDLVVHRLVKRGLRAEGLPSGGGEAYVAPPDRAQLAAWAMESSTNERRAMQAEREVVDLYRAYLMRDRVGEEFAGTVAGVTAFGIFVEIAEPFVEGLIKVERLGGGGAWRFDDRAVRLVSTLTGDSFALGDAVKVVIDNVSVQRRKIDLSLVGHEQTAPRAPVSSGRPKRAEHGASDGRRTPQRRRRS